VGAPELSKGGREEAAVLQKADWHLPRLGERRCPEAGWQERKTPPRQGMEEGGGTPFCKGQRSVAGLLLALQGQGTCGTP